MRRRDLMAAGAAAVASAPFRRAMAGRWPVPRLEEGRIVRAVAGLRPYRTGGPRLEVEELGGKRIVHNYGHGGAGVTLSWGSAEEALDLLANANASRGTAVAVAGAGVIGLTTARVAQERGFRVTVYAQAFSPHTTSDLAGAEWAPDIVDWGDAGTTRRLVRIARRSHARFLHLSGPRWGVYQRPALEADGVASGLAAVPAELVGPPRRERLTMGDRAHQILRYRSLLIEPPVFLPALTRAITGAGGRLVPRTFHRREDLLALEEAVVFDCLGLGAGPLFGDSALAPIKGQLVHLPPEPLPFILDHPEGYLVPRTDALVVGGTFEAGVTDTRTDAAVSRRILAANRAFFATG
jgi:glycine/D-amino acid oxidase-like deaminating enzyme